MVLDYVRHVLRVEDADHAETSPDAAHLAVTALSCSLVGQRHAVRFLPGSRAASLYGCDQEIESFYCNYGLNADYRAQLEDRGFIASGVDADGEVRLMELRDHPYFIGALFLPQARVAHLGPHPLLAGLADAARKYGGPRPLRDGNRAE